MVAREGGREGGEAEKSEKAWNLTPPSDDCRGGSGAVTAAPPPPMLPFRPLPFRRRRCRRRCLKKDEGRSNIIASCSLRSHDHAYSRTKNEMKTD